MNAQIAVNIIQSMPLKEVEELYELLGVEKSDRNKFSRLLETFYSIERNDVCMNIQECAEFLNCHYKTVSNHIRKGTIKAVQVGSEWRIPKMQFVEEIIADAKLFYHLKPNDKKE